jgi:hypothetical protein
MKTSSIAAAAVLAVISLNQATAGGWVVSARPNVAPLTRMVGVPFNRAPAPVGPFNRFAPFNHFGFSNQFATRFGPFGQFGFQRPFGQFEFQRPFGQFGSQPSFGVATVIPSGPVDPLPASAAESEPSAPRIIWAPSYVTVVSGGPRCDDDARLGGAKIIVIGESPRPNHAEKLPVVIYGTHAGCA